MDSNVIVVHGAFPEERALSIARERGLKSVKLTEVPNLRSLYEAENSVIYGPLYMTRNDSISVWPTLLLDFLSEASEVHKVCTECAYCQSDNAVLVYNEEPLCRNCAENKMPRNPPETHYKGSLTEKNSTISMLVHNMPVKASRRCDDIESSIVECVLVANSLIPGPGRRNYTLSVPRTFEQKILDSVKQKLKETGIGILWE